MNDILSPDDLARTLTDMFPAFAAELEHEEVTSYHQVIRHLAPVITGYLQAAPKRTLEHFCEVVNAMVRPPNRSFADMPSNSTLLTDASCSLRFACGAAKRERYA